MWSYGNYMNINIGNLLKYFATLSVSFHDINSLFGFFTFLTIFANLLSGTMLSFSLIPEPMIVPIVRNEEYLEDLYTDDFFWMHERGVDLIFVFSWLHLFRKLYLNVFEYEHEATWKSGVFSFLIFQVVVFLGLVLCCTHLSEITLTIAANIFHTFFMFYGKLFPLRKIRIYAQTVVSGLPIEVTIFSGYISSFDTSFYSGTTENDTDHQQ